MRKILTEVIGKENIESGKDPFLNDRRGFLYLLAKKNYQGKEGDHCSSPGLIRGQGWSLQYEELT